MKICIVASAGGHMSQLLKIAQSWEKYQTFCITTTDVVREKLLNYGKVYVVGECNHQHPILVFKVLLKCIRALFKEKPDIVISTGAAPGCIVCFLANLTGSKIIWIDSITNIEKLSLSGRMVRHIADLFFVQWPELTEKYKNVQFVGAIV